MAGGCLVGLLAGLGSFNHFRLPPLSLTATHNPPTPRFRLASVRHAPQLAAGTLDFTTFTWNSVLRRLRRMAVTGGCFWLEGRYYGGSTAVGGPVDPGLAYNMRHLTALPAQTHQPSQAASLRRAWSGAPAPHPATPRPARRRRRRPPPPSPRTATGTRPRAACSCCGGRGPPTSTCLTFQTRGGTPAGARRRWWWARAGGGSAGSRWRQRSWPQTRWGRRLGVASAPNSTREQCFTS
jgi:hypothetical protein